MKVGAEKKPVLYGAIVCALLAAVFVARGVMEWREATPPSQPPKNPATQGPQAKRVRGAAQAQLPKVNSLDPTLRLDLLKSSEDVEYKGTGRNIFAAYVEPPPRPVQSPLHQAQGPHCPGDPGCPPPPPPPIPLKFYGFASKAGEPKKIFLSSGDDVFIAAEGEIVNRRYRVLHIGVNSVEIEDVLQNNRQTIPLTQG